METKCLHGCPFCAGPIFIHSEYGQRFRKWLPWLPKPIASLAMAFDEYEPKLEMATELVKWCAFEGYLINAPGMVLPGPRFKVLQEAMEYSDALVNNIAADIDDDIPF